MLESRKRILDQVSELIQMPVEPLFSLYRGFPSGDNNARFEGFCLSAYRLTVVSFIGYEYLCTFNFFDERGRFCTVIDVPACDGEYVRQTFSIDGQMDLGCVASSAFTDVFIVTGGGSGAVVVRFYIAAINEDQLQVRVGCQPTKELFPDAFFRPVIERLVDGVPLAEMLWQISPWYASTHSEQNTFDCPA